MKITNIKKYVPKQTNTDTLLYKVSTMSNVFLIFYHKNIQNGPLSLSTNFPQLKLWQLTLTDGHINIDKMYVHFEVNIIQSYHSGIYTDLPQPV